MLSHTSVQTDSTKHFQGPEGGDCPDDFWPRGLHGNQRLHAEFAQCVVGSLGLAFGTADPKKESQSFFKPWPEVPAWKELLTLNIPEL